MDYYERRIYFVCYRSHYTQWLYKEKRSIVRKVKDDRQKRLEIAGHKD